MNFLLWAALLLLLGLALVALEMFIPSGGVLGVLSALSILAAIVLAFFDGPGTGLAFVLTTAVAIPAILAAALRVWPDTPMGRHILLGVPTPEEVLPDSPLRRELKSLVGKYGVAKSVMLPSGVVLVEGQSVDAVGQGMAIEPGQRIKVIEVRGTRVVVRPVDDESTGADDDPLSRPISTLGIDSLENPFA
ncbi:MAG: hypothetical protein JNG90_15555 [Planctomycetaceae bacterium]|nr:hypothetical protein [Planctomycetaceae bacterium]